MARGSLDEAAAAMARWAGIPITECPLCGAVVETEDLEAGSTWKCDECGAESVVVDDTPAEAATECPTCHGTKTVPAVDIESGDETETVPCPDCGKPAISSLDRGDETGKTAGQPSRAVPPFPPASMG